MKNISCIQRHTEVPELVRSHCQCRQFSFHGFDQRQRVGNGIANGAELRCIGCGNKCFIPYLVIVGGGGINGWPYLPSYLTNIGNGRVRRLIEEKADRKWLAGAEESLPGQSCPDR